MKTKKKVSAAQAAADVLDELAPESGKQCLPEAPQLEHEHKPSEEVTDDIVFTDQDRNDFLILDKQINEGQRKSFEACREVRRRKLFRLILDDGGQPKYRSFDGYIEQEKGHTRQWVTQGTNWLVIIETLEQLSVPVPSNLSVRAAQALVAAEVKEAGGLLVILEEAISKKMLSESGLKEIVRRRVKYNTINENDDGEEYREVAAENYEEYCRDLEVIEAAFPGTNFLPGGGGWKDRLADDYTGDDLVAKVAELQNAAADDAAAKAEKEELEEMKRLFREKKKQLADGLSPLRDEVQALAAAIAAKKKEMDGDEEADDTNEDSTPDAPKVDESVPEDMEESEERLSNVSGLLDDVLTTAFPDDEVVLRKFLGLAEEVQGKTAEVIAKVKQALADVEQPEAIPT